MTFPSISDQKILYPRTYSIYDYYKWSRGRVERERDSHATSPTCAAASLACFLLSSFVFLPATRETVTNDVCFLVRWKIDFKFSSLNKKKLKSYFCWIQEAPTSDEYVLTFQDYKQMETDFLLIRQQKLAIFVLPNNQNFELILKYLNVL